MRNSTFRHQILESGLFDAAWYLSRYPDVEGLGLDPLEHYLRFGAALGRAPGPDFDGPGYLALHHDVERAGVDPLLHYIRHGRREGRLLPGPIAGADFDAALTRLEGCAAAEPEGEPARYLATFDRHVQTRFIADLQTVHSRARNRVDGTLASIIMPVHNRGPHIARAIESVLAQTHVHWELLIIDDGSTDDTVQRIAGFLADPRIRLLRQKHKGVSAARNTGLAEASGEVVFYLDSDNRWTSPYLRSMLTYLQATGRQCAYSALTIENAEGKIDGYRGEPFSWQHCLLGNYVDLNVFCHSIGIYRRLGGFDEQLRRMVDWDLILGYSRDAPPAFAPFIGCYYSNSAADRSRISVSQPYAYRALVQLKHRLGSGNREAIAAALKLNFSIRVAAPRERRNEWGDYHYAESLAAALQSLGHQASVAFRDEWYETPPQQHHVVVLLRGLLACEPNPEQVNVLWNISHPDQVSYQEYESHDIAYVASASYPDLLNSFLGKPVRPLLQCTDSGRFKFARSRDTVPGGVLFVGNSRNHFRRVVRWATGAGVPVQVHGTRWEQFIGPDHIAGTHIPNEQLARHYATAGVVLNDHWDSMRDFGLVSNRVFDVLACGGHLVSDTMPSISTLFGDHVTQVDSGQALAAAVADAAAAPPPFGKALDASHMVHREHSFDVRAAMICRDVLQHLGLPVPDLPGVAAPLPGHHRGRRKRVALLLQSLPHGPTSSGFIRLLAPLTTDLAHSRVEIVPLANVRDQRLNGCDVCIVQRVAVPHIDEATLLLERLADQGTELYVDNDDAFLLIDDSHPERDAYRDGNGALLHLMQYARQVWFSTGNLRALYCDAAADGIVVSNNLDPRLWRDYRRPERSQRPAGRLKMLYMGTRTHDADFAMLLPALDRLEEQRPGSFELTLVGAVRNAPKRSWLRIDAMPPDAYSYPRFVRWLLQQGPFDVGLAPLLDTPFNACKSDIKILDYAALGLPALVSDVPAYRSEAGDQRFVVRAANTTEAWLSALLDLVGHPAQLIESARAASAYVWEQRTVTHTARQLLSGLS